MRRTRALVAGLVVLGIAATVAVVARRSSVGDTPNDSTATAAAPSEARAEGARRGAADGRVTSPGVVHEWTVDIEQETSLAQDARRSTLKLALHGRLGSTFVGLEGERLRMRVSLADGRLTATPVKPGITDAVHELARPFYVVVDRNGSVTGLQVSRETSHVARGLARVLASATQVTTKDGSTWIAQELDPTGRYEASYERRPDGSIVRRKTRYVEIGGATKLEPVESVGKVTTAGTMQASLDPTGWLVSLNGAESTTIESGPLMPRISSVTSARLAIAGEHRDPEALGAYERDAQNLVDVPIAGGEGDPAAARRADEDLVGNASLPSLIDAARAGTDAPNGRAALQKLEARVRLHDDDAEVVARRAETSDATEGRRLSAALAGAGTAAATKANAGILERRKASAAVRTQAAVSLGFAEQGQAEAARALTNGLSDPDAEVRRASLLGLGGIARGMRESDPENAAGAIGELLGRWRAATNDEEREAALRALGNTGDPVMVPIVREVLASGSDGLRAVAADALRFVTNTAADELLDRVVATDPASAVRASAVEAIGFRDVARHEAVVVRALGADDASTVRAESARVAARSVARVPGFTPALRHAAETDPSEDVRAIASAAVGL